LSAAVKAAPESCTTFSAACLPGSSSFRSDSISPAALADDRFEVGGVIAGQLACRLLTCFNGFERLVGLGEQLVGCLFASSAFVLDALASANALSAAAFSSSPFGRFLFRLEIAFGLGQCLADFFWLSCSPSYDCWLLRGPSLTGRCALWPATPRASIRHLERGPNVTFISATCWPSSRFHSLALLTRWRTPTACHRLAQQSRRPASRGLNF